MVLPLPEIPTRIVAAPMAGGPTTPRLVAAVGEAGGLGFLAAGYRTPDDVAAQVEEVRRLSSRPFGVNIFAPVGRHARDDEVERYARLVEDYARTLGVEVGEPRHTDDDFDAKCELVRDLRPAVVSFAFGLPGPDVIEAFHDARIPVLVTAATPADAERAQAAGVDAVVLQGAEAGGHRGGLVDDGEGFGLLSLLRLTTRSVDVPLVAAGGLADGASVAAVLAAGASAAMLGTAFLRCPEAGTSPVHADALTEDRPTVVTRAFTGRSARAVANSFADRFGAHAPGAYPEVHFLTAPIRAHARRSGDPENLHLWAGQAHRLARQVPAGQLVRELADETCEASSRLTRMTRAHG